MDQPLGRAVGNALEVKEILQLLHGGGPPDLRELTVALTAEMLVLGGVAAGADEARARVEQAIADGRGFRKLCEIVEAQGGDPGALAEPGRLRSRRRPPTSPRRPPDGSRPSTPRRWGSPPWRWAPGARGSRTGWTRRPVSRCGRSRRSGGGGRDARDAARRRGAVESPGAVAARVRNAYRIGAGPASAGPLVLERIEEAA